jgi:hypothetical protein
MDLPVAVLDPVTPDVIQPDQQAKWEVAKALWMQGIKPKEICAQLGVTEGALKMQAHRKRWNEVKEQAYRVQVTRVQQETRITDLRKDVTGILKQQVAALQGVTWTPKLTKEYAGTMRDLVHSASTVEGWSDSTNVRVDIHALSLPPGEPGSLLGPVVPEIKACLPEPVEPPKDGAPPL